MTTISYWPIVAREKMAELFTEALITDIPEPGSSLEDFGKVLRKRDRTSKYTRTIPNKMGGSTT
jgi:hypothetical protein